MDEAFNLYNEKANQLGTAIEQEVQNRIAADTEIITNVENLNANLTNYKTEVSNTYTTKEESTSLHNDINKSITDLDTTLRNEIATQVTGANKWVNQSPVETLDDLNKLELDDNFNWLCRVTNESGYTYQRIAGSTE
jgi:seryl-tRNA synthetase